MKTATISVEFTPGFRFDWYQGTVRVDEFGTYPDRLVDRLSEQLGAVAAVGAPGLHGYAHQTSLRAGSGETVAQVLYGGANKWPNVTGSGDAAPAVARVLRTLDHHVTRLDVAYDVCAPGAFDKMCSVALRVADERGLTVNHAGDWHRKSGGRTLYVGSQKSDFFVRIYEKGLEQRAKAPTAEAALAVPAEWTRVEPVYRPKKPAKRLLAASMAPGDVWGVSLWGTVMAERLLALRVPRIERMSWKQTSDEVALDWMARQYGAALRRRAAVLGSYDLLWAEVERKVRDGEE